MREPERSKVLEELRTAAVAAYGEERSVDMWMREVLEIALVRGALGPSTGPAGVAARDGSPMPRAVTGRRRTF